MSASEEPARLRPAPGGHRPMFHRIFPADPRTVRNALVILRERFGNSAEIEVIGRLELALAEVLNNICQHGMQEKSLQRDGTVKAPMIHLCVIRHVGGIACAVTDDGTALPPDCLQPRQLPRHDAVSGYGEDPADLPEGGFGWFLIQELSASLSYFREGQRNFLGFIIPIGGTCADGTGAMADSG